MKKLIVAAIAVCLVFISGSATAFALGIDGPHGEVINGWFKDQLTAAISGNCSGSSTNFNFNYSSSDSGTHTYVFYTDENGSPYVNIDSGGYSALDNQPCGFSLKYLIGIGMTQAGQFRASVDSQPPSVSINNPTGTATTTASSYNVTGIVSDPENNLSSIKAIISGGSGASVSVSGNTFHVTVPLRMGSNTVQMVAYDGVGHSATSNTATINRTNPPSAGGGSTNSTSASNSGGASASTAPNADVQFNPQQLINIDDPYADQVNSDPSAVQAASALSGIPASAYLWLVAVILILVAGSLYFLNKNHPLMETLRKSKSGLRRRIIIVVALPSIIPLLGLGILGYQQLSTIVKNSLSDQLDKASQTSALKLQREFGIRQIVITKTASDILQIQSQYKSQIDQLAQQKASCQQVVSDNIPSGKFSTVTSSTNCLPFLTGFAQVETVSTKVGDYLNALNKGADSANNNLVTQEDERVNELLGSLRNYFPDLTEVDIVDATKNANVQALLPNTDPNQPTISDTHKDLLTVASNKKVVQVGGNGKSQQLLLTYPVTSSNKVIGGVVISVDTGNFAFIPSIWQSTPKPYSTDQVFFVSTAGDIIAPQSASDKQLQSQIKPLAANPLGAVFNLTVNGQMLATRTTSVPNTNLVVAVGAPASSVLAPLAGIQAAAILAIIGFVLLSVLLGIWFVSRIADEVDKLYIGAQNYSNGDLDYRIELESGDELQALGDTMNQMASDIKDVQAAMIQKDKDFINVATHELRAPITAIIGFLSMVVEDGMGSVDDKAKKLIEQAYGGTKRLRDIINDMLDIARLESGHSEFKIEPVDIQELTQSIVDMQSIVAQQAGLTLTYEAGEKVPRILADKSKLQIILTNFVSNAIKYNRPHGTIIVSHTIDANKLITSVSDTGLGIPDDQKAHMFQKFYRVQHEDRSSVQGTGLGLHITKRFIEAMGGTVWFESTHGKGTTFHFTLPLAEPKPATQMPTPKPATPEIKKEPMPPLPQ